MRRIVIGLLAWLLAAMPAVSQPLVEIGASAQASTIISTETAIPAVSTQVTLAHPCRHVVVTTAPGSAALRVNFANGTATSSNGAVYPSAAVVMDGVSIKAFKVKGDAATGSYSIFAY